MGLFVASEHQKTNETIALDVPPQGQTSCHSGSPLHKADDSIDNVIQLLKAEGQWWTAFLHEQ